MDGVGAVAVVALGVTCVAQEWVLVRLVTRLLPPGAPAYRQDAPKPFRGRSGSSLYEENRHFRHHPSGSEWPTQGEPDDRT